MLAFGFGLGAIGYAIVYYGAHLWTGNPVTLAQAFGFGGNQSFMDGVKAGVATTPSAPTPAPPTTPRAKSGPLIGGGKVPAPIIAP